MEGIDALNAVLTEYDSPTKNAAPEETAQPETEPETTEETTEPKDPAPTEGQTETPEGQEEPDESPESVFQNSKQNKAFAEMRVQNKRLNEIVKNLGRIMEVPDGTEPEKLIELAESRLTELRAQAEKVPVELYKELESTRRRQAEIEQESIKQQATLAFQKVKDHYGLDNKKLVEFAQQLNDAGKNPFTTPMDLVQEYRNLNWEKIIEDEKKKVEKEYQDRLKKAQTKSTSPSKATGGSGPDTSTTVSSMSDFNRLLEGMK